MSDKTIEKIRLLALEALASKIVDKYPDWPLYCPAEEEKFLLYFAKQSVGYIEKYGKDYGEASNNVSRRIIIDEINTLRETELKPLMEKYHVTRPHYFTVVGQKATAKSKLH